LKGGRRSVGWLLGLAVFLAVVWLIVVAASHGAGPSVHSRGADGWAAARLYTESQGIRLEIPRGLQEQPQEPVWVTAFPWRRSGGPDRLESLQHFASEGGHLVVAYSGSGGSLDETRLLSQLGAPLHEARSRPPFRFQAWRRHRLQEWDLRPVQGQSRDGRIRALNQVPKPPPEAQILYQAKGDEDETLPLVFSFPLGRGQVLLFPAALLANARLGQAGNGDFLANLCRWLGDRWAVDELAQGLPPTDVPAVSRTNRRAFDLFGLHLLALYGLGLWALGRRFGPAWRDPPVRLGSTGSFLAGLGTLHERLGHRDEAARRLIQRTRQLHPDLSLPPDLEDPEAKPAVDLLTLARRLVALRFPSRGAP
jgi:hypothetical protein